MKKLWEETKRQIEAINDNEPTEYRKGFMKIRFESDDDFSLDKALSNTDMITVVASVLEKNDQHYPQFFYMNARISYKNTAIRKN